MKQDLEADAVKQAFRRRWIRQLVVTVIALAALALSGAFTRHSSAGTSAIPPYLLVAILIGLVGFSLVNWRCPACNRYLYRAMYPRHCSGCGVQLR